VEPSDRERLLWSMVKVAGAKGYDSISVDEVARRAGVSRSAFYDEFKTKDECLFAAYDVLIEDLLGRVEDAFSAQQDWPTKVRAGLEALLTQFAAEPELARVAAVEMPAAGTEGHRRFREAIERFVGFLAEGPEYAERGAELPDDIGLMAVGGAEAIIFDEVVAGRTRELPRLLPELVFAVLVPYLGPADAAQEMRRAGQPG
jgi:AcrR family transcriptional regulator